MSINRMDSTPARISTNVSTARQTPKRDFGDRMKTGVSSALGVQPGSVGVGAMVPGGAILSACLDVFSGFGAGLEEMERVLRVRPDAAQPAIRDTINDIRRLKMQIAMVARRIGPS